MSAYQQRLFPQTREKILMLEPNDFFQNQVKQCRSQAESATNKRDREFWLQLAHRWEMLLPAGAATATTLDNQSFAALLDRAIERSRTPNLIDTKAAEQHPPEELRGPHARLRTF